MTIKYSNGRAVEAVLLSRTQDTMRLAVQGADDAMEVSNINGTWVAADCEPVSIEFIWQRRVLKPAITEADCLCSRDLAARLIHSLYTGANEATSEAETPVELPQTFSINQLMV